MQPNPPGLGVEGKITKHQEAHNRCHLVDMLLLLSVGNPSAGSSHTLSGMTPGSTGQRGVSREGLSRNLTTLLEALFKIALFCRFRRRLFRLAYLFVSHTLVQFKDPV